MRHLLLSATLIAAAAPALADETTGVLLAYDRLANLIVLQDRTVYELGDMLVPADLQSGDRITLVFQTAGEDGITKVQELTREE